MYHKLQADLEAKGVLFLDMDSGLREHEDIVKQYMGTIIPQNDNKFAALNSAVWSGGSFIYVPPGVKIEIRSRRISASTRRTWASSSAH